MAGLVRRATDAVAADETAIAGAGTALARQLGLSLATKRKFLAALEARLAEIVGKMATHEREQAAILAKLGAKSAD